MNIRKPRGRARNLILAESKFLFGEGWAMFDLSLVQVIQARRCLCGIAVDLQLEEEVNYVYSGRLIEYMWTSESI